MAYRFRVVQVPRWFQMLKYAPRCNCNCTRSYEHVNPSRSGSVPSWLVVPPVEGSGGKARRGEARRREVK